MDISCTSTHWIHPTRPWTPPPSACTLKAVGRDTPCMATPEWIKRDTNTYILNFVSLMAVKKDNNY
jgi:hypothetical protein